MPIGLDDVHPCPLCGSPWKIAVQFLDEHRWVVPANTGWCADPDCEINRDDERLRGYRSLRRSSSWDASE